MSLETTMYALKPIVSLPSDVHRSKTMYEMRNIHEERSRDDHTGGEIVPTITEQSPLPEFGALEARQEKILAQLAQLKKQVSTLCDFLKQTNQAVAAKTCKNEKPVNVDLIINTNPKRPPYSILALQKVWKDTDVRVKTYLHSSINEKEPIVYQSNSNSSKNNVINVALIWKQVEDLELITNNNHSYRITGESNLLRYISRLINTHNYENSTCHTEVNTTDLILDLCHCLHYEESTKKKQEILSSIVDKIESNWTGKEMPNIADIAAWSVIKQVIPKEDPSKFKKWFQTCEKLFV